MISDNTNSNLEGIFAEANIFHEMLDDFSAQQVPIDDVDIKNSSSEFSDFQNSFEARRTPPSQDFSKSSQAIAFNLLKRSSSLQPKQLQQKGSTTDLKAPTEIDEEQIQEEIVEDEGEGEIDNEPFSKEEQDYIPEYSRFKAFPYFPFDDSHQYIPNWTNSDEY